MKKNLCLAFYSLLFFTGAYSQSTARGYVYEDANGNGKKEKKEKGIPGVGVCNGKDIVLTNEKGLYQLPVGNDNIIFVIKPANYRVAVNGKNLPSAYYIYKPLGSPPSLRYKGTPPTGTLPASIDFPLTRAEEGQKFSVLVFGDPQVYTEDEIGYFRRSIVQEVEGNTTASFGISLGDIIGDTLDLYHSYIDAVQKVGIPWYNLMGNHDVNRDVNTDSLSDETFEAHFGPANISFNYGNAHFIVLDDIFYPDKSDGTVYVGGFRDDQLQFIENDLKLVDTSKLVVLAYHIPLKNDIRKKDRDFLFRMLEKFPHTLSLSAHTHLQRNDFFDTRDGFRRDKPHHEYNAGTACGDWYNGELNSQGIPMATMRDGTPRGYAFLNITGNAYTIDYKVAGKPASYQMEIFCPKVVPFESWITAAIYANYFMGSREDTVQYRFDDRAWKNMDYFENADPSYLALLYPWEMSEHLLPGRRPSNPSRCTHLWRGSFPWMPEYLSLGHHTVEIRVRDRYGRTFTGSKEFLVEKPVAP